MPRKGKELDIEKEILHFLNERNEYEKHLEKYFEKKFICSHKGTVKLN